MNFECHITVNVRDAETAQKVATALHWKTSEIARDPVLGQATYFYLTSHASSYDNMFTRMTIASGALISHGIEIVREKIEHIVYDTKNGIRP